MVQQSYNINIHDTFRGELKKIWLGLVMISIKETYFFKGLGVRVGGMVELKPCIPKQSVFCNFSLDPSI